MQLNDAKELVGNVCSVRWKDRNGTEKQTVSKIYDATYVPLYGGYLVTATEDIRLDRIVDVALVEQGSPTTVRTEASFSVLQAA